MHPTDNLRDFVGGVHSVLGEASQYKARTFIAKTVLGMLSPLQLNLIVKNPIAALSRGSHSDRHRTGAIKAIAAIGLDFTIANPSQRLTFL